MWTSKIVPSWSLDDALQALEAKSIPYHDKLARFKKTLFLVACAASNRSDELSAIARNDVVFRDNAVIFKPREGFLLKNQSQFNPPLCLGSLPCRIPPYAQLGPLGSTWQTPRPLQSLVSSCTRSRVNP